MLSCDGCSCQSTAGPGAGIAGACIVCLSSRPCPVCGRIASYSWLSLVACAVCYTCCGMLVPYSSSRTLIDSPAIRRLCNFAPHPVPSTTTGRSVSQPAPDNASLCAPPDSPSASDLKGRVSMARPNEAPDLLHWWNPRKIILQMAILQAAYTLTATILITLLILVMAIPFRIDYFFLDQSYRSDNVFGFSLSLLSLLTAFFTYVFLPQRLPNFTCSCCS